MREVRTPAAAVPGGPGRFDAEYERHGVGHPLMYDAPFDDWRRTDAALDHGASTWAEGVRRLFVYTPKPGGWLNMAELEFSVPARQCLDRRIADLETLGAEVNAWPEQRNRTSKVVHWRFTTADARAKLPHLYPVIRD